METLSKASVEETQEGDHQTNADIKKPTTLEKSSSETVITKQQLPHSPISKMELLCCAVFFLSVVGCGLKNIYDAATDISTDFRFSSWSEMLEPGRFVKHHFRDFGDMEWEAFESNCLALILCGLANAVINGGIGYFKVSWLRRWSVSLVGLAFMVATCGTYNTAIIVAESLTVYATMRISGFPLLFGWLAGAAHIFLVLPSFNGDIWFYPGNKYSAAFAIWCWFWNIMRFVSFASEWQCHNNGIRLACSKGARAETPAPPDEQFSSDKTSMKSTSEVTTSEDATATEVDFCISSFLGYFLYTPTLFGAILTYRSFHEQVLKPSCHEFESERKTLFTVRKFLHHLAVVAGWLLLCLAWNELFMLYALEQQPAALHSLNGFGAGVITWAHGQYFQAKYMVVYGLPWLLAFLDKVELTPLPICISRVYLYSDMWKHFDTGLYEFLKNHIYVPVGQRYGRQLGGAATFFFIWAWHGTTATIALWTICNFAQITVEGIMRRASNNPKSPLVKYVRSQVSASCWRRLEALACSVSFTFSLFAIGYFLMGHEAASCISSRTFWPGNVNLWLCILTSYGWVQTVFSYENLMANKHL